MPQTLQAATGEHLIVASGRGRRFGRSAWLRRFADEHCSYSSSSSSVPFGFCSPRSAPPPVGGTSDPVGSSRTCSGDVYQLDRRSMGFDRLGHTCDVEAAQAHWFRSGIAVSTAGGNNPVPAPWRAVCRCWDISQATSACSILISVFPRVGLCGFYPFYCSCAFSTGCLVLLG